MGTGGGNCAVLENAPHQLAGTPLLRRKQAMKNTISTVPTVLICPDPCCADIAPLKCSMSVKCPLLFVNSSRARFRTPPTSTAPDVYPQGWFFASDFPRSLLCYFVLYVYLYYPMPLFYVNFRWADCVTPPTKHGPDVYPQGWFSPPTSRAACGA